MTDSATVQRSLTEILGRVVDCAPEAVVPTARLGKDLGVDSLSMIEVCEKLGQDFGVYICDEAVNSIVTVRDAVDAIVDHNGEARGPKSPYGASSASDGALVSTALFEGPSPQRTSYTPDEIKEKKRDAWHLVGRMAVVGLAIGVVLGIGGTALIRATGINDIEPPPSPATSEPTAAPSPEETPSPTPTPEPTEEEEGVEGPATLTTDNTSAGLGERIVLTGTFEEAGAGALLQVQIKDGDEPWDDFPVTTRTDDQGGFRTIVRTSNGGDRDFRLLHEDSGDATPSVTITIG